MGMTQTYLCKQATVAGIALPGSLSFTVTKAGQKVDTRSDAELMARVSPMINVEETIEVEARDVGISPAFGTTGATTLVAAKHLGGVNLSGTLTCTAASSTISNVVHTVNQEGTPVVRVTLSVNSADGVASGIAWA